ncbi:MAG: DNA mismatch repair protein MutS [Clostridiaceae bacterium]
MALTPMMTQYLQIKEECKDTILFFRLGDFYEMFFEDAKTASRELELVLTGRDCGLEERAPMCGIPYHSSNIYISRLVAKGYKVAICEQLEDPSATKTIVKRGIVKIYTPGTYSDSAFLEEKRNNYIMSLFIEDNNVGLSFSDISTGEFLGTNFNYDLSILMNEISKFSPKEILLSDDAIEVIEFLRKETNITLTLKPSQYFKNEELNLNSQFNNIDIDSLNHYCFTASVGLLNYINETQKLNLNHINNFEYYNIFNYLTMDMNTRKNLELTESLREKSKKYSLLWVLDKTSTAMGARELVKWIEQPLINKNDILDRLDAVEELTNSLSKREELKEALKQIYDIERLVGKVSSKNVNAKELITLKNSIGRIPRLKEILSTCSSKLLKDIYENLDELNDIYSLIETSIDDSPSISVKEGNIIKEGFNAEIDELRAIKTQGKNFLAELEAKEREITCIKSLKISYNKVFGYYIEVTKSNVSSVPADRYIRKQTLANAERYITEELKIMEEKILGSEDKLTQLEYTLFCEVREEIEKEIIRMQNSAKLVSILDVLLSFSYVAIDNNYIKPNIADKDALKITNGRHPVVELILQRGNFVSNDTFLDNDKNLCALITGPNMGGKSTYMRQNALIVLMAQIGSFVPAEGAEIPICDKIFTRIGASDDLAGGKSTFMVEMSEVSNILQNATPKSLVILDEIGRGTSTFDGLSIAWAIMEYLVTNKKVRCKTLFSTHYHELTTLEESLSGIVNYSLGAKKINDDLIFLHKIIKGAADESYGIEVAKLAGLPQAVIERSKAILNELENNSNKNNVVKISETTSIGTTSELTTIDEVNISNEISTAEEVKEIKVKTKSSAVKKTSEVAITQLDFEFLNKDNLINELRALDIMNMTPLECMNRLNKLINKAKEIVK